MDLNCCNANAPRAFVMIPGISYMTDQKGVVVNLYSEGEASVPFAGNNIKIKQFTDYPVTGKISLEVTPQVPAEFTIKLRVPHWSRKSSALINGKTVQGISPGKYLSITRIWKQGDLVDLTLDMRGQVEYIRDGNHLHACILRGPVLLARDNCFDRVDEDEIAKPQLDNDGYLELAPANSGDVWMLFTGKFQAGSVLEG